MKTIKQTCIVDTPYSLALYLLFSNDKDMMNTMFFVGTNMPQSIVNNLPNVKCFTKGNKWGYFQMFKFRVKCLKYRRLLCKTKVFAQDHLFFSYGLLDNVNYTLLEDAPSFFRIYNNFDHFKYFYKETPKGRLRNLLIGSNYGKMVGQNKNCINRLITSVPKDNYLPNAQFTLCNMYDMWKESSEFKQMFIKKVFDVKDDDFSYQNGVIIFTQPFIEDCGLTEQEQMDIYKPYINKYSDYSIVIKKHPRDHFNYQKYFPNVRMMNTNAPMQVLSVMGLDFRIAVTVSSSAVTSMKKDTVIEWIGTNVNKKIFDVYGKIDCPVLDGN